MDQFYQDLRQIQKKERNNATLARVEEDFYNQLHEYMDRLRKQAIEYPFSNLSEKKLELKKYIFETKYAPVSLYTMNEKT